MFQLSLLNFYLMGRVIFAVALQVAFHFIGNIFIFDKLVLLIGLYSFIALIRLIYRPQSVHYFDFLLDIFFISLIIFMSFNFYSYSYLTLLYLFPIFFSSLSVKGKSAFLFPFIAIISYGVICTTFEVFFQKENLFNLALHFISFMLIFIAGREVSNRLLVQQEHIKRLEEDRIKMQGYERLFRVSADLAHELRNPLTSVFASIQFIKEGKDPNDFIDILDEETNRISGLINDFLIFSRPSEATKEVINISSMIQRLVNNLNDNDKIIETFLDESIEVFANKTFLESAIGNVIKNAIEASKKRIKISVKKINNPPFGVSVNGQNPLLEISIEDDGQGISETIKEKIFEPFFTTKPKGTGLGLALAYRIVTDIGGNISIDKSKLGGANFKIYIPSKI